jgi:hypothetical protein
MMKFGLFWITANPFDRFNFLAETDRNLKEEEEKNRIMLNLI